MFLDLVFALCTGHKFRWILHVLGIIVIFLEADYFFSRIVVKFSVGLTEFCANEMIKCCNNIAQMKR